MTTTSTTTTEPSTTSTTSSRYLIHLSLSLSLFSKMKKNKLEPTLPKRSSLFFFFFEKKKKGERLASSLAL